jgi:S-formylglutathione hydrolase FrmB
VDCAVLEIHRARTAARVKAQVTGAGRIFGTHRFAIDAAADVEGFVAVGSNDHGYVAAELRLVDTAQRDHMRVRLDVIAGGGHNFRTWAHALRDAYPWIVERLQTPPTSTYNEVRATQPARSSHPHRHHTTPVPRIP